MEETAYWHDMELHQRLALIGKTVMVGLFVKDGEEYLGSVTGTLMGVGDSEDRVAFTFNGEGNTVRYDSEDTVALVSWLADDR